MKRKLHFAIGLAAMVRAQKDRDFQEHAFVEILDRLEVNQQPYQRPRRQIRHQDGPAGGGRDTAPQRFDTSAGPLGFERPRQLQAQQCDGPADPGKHSGGHSKESEYLSNRPEDLRRDSGHSEALHPGRPGSTQPRNLHPQPNPPLRIGGRMPRPGM
jgi:hypothetical protein